MPEPLTVVGYVLFSFLFLFVVIQVSGLYDIVKGLRQTFQRDKDVYDEGKKAYDAAITAKLTTGEAAANQRAAMLAAYLKKYPESTPEQADKAVKDILALNMSTEDLIEFIRVETEYHQAKGNDEEVEKLKKEKQDLLNRVPGGDLGGNNDEGNSGGNGGVGNPLPLPPPPEYPGGDPLPPPPPRVNGNGTLNALCGTSADSLCDFTKGLECKTTNRCGYITNVAQGRPCSVNTQCESKPGRTTVCKTDNTCGIVNGDGTRGSLCGEQGDAPCSISASLVCRDDGSNKKCLDIFSKSRKNGESCGKSDDCESGNICSTNNVCVTGPTSGGGGGGGGGGGTTPVPDTNTCHLTRLQSDTTCAWKPLTGTNSCEAGFRDGCGVTQAALACTGVGGTFVYPNSNSRYQCTINSSSTPSPQICDIADFLKRADRKCDWVKDGTDKCTAGSKPGCGAPEASVECTSATAQGYNFSFEHRNGPYICTRTTAPSTVTDATNTCNNLSNMQTGKSCVWKNDGIRCIAGSTSICGRDKASQECTEAGHTFEHRDGPYICTEKAQTSSLNGGIADGLSCGGNSDCQSNYCFGMKSVRPGSTVQKGTCRPVGYTETCPGYKCSSQQLSQSAICKSDLGTYKCLKQDVPRQCISTDSGLNNPENWPATGIAGSYALLSPGCWIRQEAYTSPANIKSRYKRL